MFGKDALLPENVQILRKQLVYYRQDKCNHHLHKKWSANLDKVRDKSPVDKQVGEKRTLAPAVAALEAKLL